MAVLVFSKPLPIHDRNDDAFGIAQGGRRKVVFVQHRIARSALCPDDGWAQGNNHRHHDSKQSPPVGPGGVFAHA